MNMREGIGRTGDGDCMMGDTGRVPSGQALAVPVEPVSRLDPSGFDPSRGDFLQHLRRRNSARLAAWEGDTKADPLFHAAELGGEVGELLNVVKKLHREAMGWRGSRATETDLSEEVGDVLICLDKLAAQYGINIADATIAKFNMTSDKVGLPHKLGAFYRCEHCGAGEREARSTHCAPPFTVQPHAFTGNHPADLHAIAMEARQGGDAKQAPSQSDDSAVGNADVPKGCGPKEVA